MQVSYLKRLTIGSKKGAGLVICKGSQLVQGECYMGLKMWVQIRLIMGVACWLSVKVN